MATVADSLHNQTIPYNAIKLRLPTRQAFIAPTDAAIVDETIANKRQLMFLPTYLMETHMQDVKYEKALYKIILMGILRDGRRINVILDDIKPYFEVQLPDSREEQEAAINKIIDLLEADDLTSPSEKSIINAKPFKYYRESKAKFLRLYYTKTKSRVAAIQLIRKNGYTTTSDDTASYYRVICRDYLTTFSSWATLDDYKKVGTSDLLKGTTYRVSIKNYKAFTGELTGDLLKDKTMSVCWDIETWSKDGDLPVPENKDDNIFCLSMTFQWVNENEPFYKVCLCDYPANAKQGYLTIVCGNEQNIIRGFAEIFELMRPEFIFGFNDSDYDWNWVIKRAAQYKGLLSYIAGKLDSTKPYQPYTDDGVFKWNFKKEHVKVEADSYIDGFALMVHGYIPIDVRTIFRRLYPTAEQSSLKWFLAKNKLGGKEDMPYEEMFKIYRQYRDFMTIHADESDEVIAGHAIDLPTDKWGPSELEIYNNLKKKLMDINYYCVIDAQRCHDLVKIRSVVMDHREVSNLSYCSVYDAFFRANGMKVRNLTIAVGQGKQFGMRFSNITNEGAEEGKYPGAFVLPPRKGLKITKLSVNERIKKAELTKNMPAPACQDWIGTTQEEVDKFHSIVDKYGAIGTAESLAIVEAELNEKLPKKFKDFWMESIGRPITGLDFSSLYPSLIRAYNFSPEFCILDKKQAQAVEETGQKITKVDFDFHGKRKVAYFVWHNNKYNPEEPGFQFGVYPYILDDLFKKRAILKKAMKKYTHRKEEIEAMSPEAQLAVSAEYDDVVFNNNYLNSKQNALKVFMNTFYGEAGNRRSPFFVMEVAGGITSYGQKNIKFAYAFVREKECGVYYGDSVTADTPIPIRRADNSYYTEIQDLTSNDSYQQYNNGKEIAFPVGLEVWSDKGWTRIKHVIRHKTDKQIYCINTKVGYVCVTKDHSLLDINGAPIKPCDSVGIRLLTSNVPHMNNMPMNSTRGSIYQAITYKTDSTDSTVVSITPIQYSGYVYDIETENHHFAAGVGNLVVHNTDSLYLSTPEKFFDQADREFYSGRNAKLDYWTKLVEITFKEINPIRDGVNKAFVENNGTQFLSMAYEEVLAPVAFTAKKKYFGIAHDSIPNFKPKDLFIRGLEVKKRGVSELLRKIFMEIMWTACNPDNVYDLVELVLMKIDEIYSRKWTSHDFIQTGVYRPGKNNVKIKTLVERMKDRNIEVKPNERFNYVIVKKYPYYYDLRGRKVELSVGDKLELAEEFEKQKDMEIDLDYYMQGSINGQLARLITYHDMFKVDPADTTDEEIKIAEDRIYKNACKFIESYCAKYYANYNTFGKTHQKIFKTASKSLITVIKEHDELVGDLLGANVNFDDFEAWFVEYTEKKADKAVNEYGKEFITQELDRTTELIRSKYNAFEEDDPARPSDIDINKEIKSRRAEKLQLLQKNYYGNRTSILDRRELSYRNTMSILRKKLRENHQRFMKAYGKYNHTVDEIKEMMCNKIGGFDELLKPTKVARDFTLDDFEVDEAEVFNDEIDEYATTKANELLDDPQFWIIINDLKILHNNILSAHLLIKRTRDIVAYLKLRRDNIVRMTVRPDETVIRQMLQESADTLKDDVQSLDI